MWIYSNFDSPFSPGHDWAGFVHNKNKYSYWECIHCFMKNLFSIINPSGLEQIHTFVVISMSCTHTICLPAKMCECWGGINYSTMRSYREIHKKTCGDTVCNCSLLKQIKALISARTMQYDWAVRHNMLIVILKMPGGRLHSTAMLLLNIDLLIVGLVSWTSRIGVKGE